VLALNTVPQIVCALGSSGEGVMARMTANSIARRGSDSAEGYQHARDFTKSDAQIVFRLDARQSERRA
jgi:hypothetical protein